MLRVRGHLRIPKNNQKLSNGSVSRLAGEGEEEEEQEEDQGHLKGVCAKVQVTRTWGVSQNSKTGS